MTATTSAAASASGLGYMAWSAFWFAIMGLFVKLAGATLPTMQIVFVRGCIVLAIAATAVWRARVSPFGHAPRLLFLRGFVGSCALVCFYAAVVKLPLAEATVIHQTAPLFTAVLAAWTLHERLEARVLWSIVVCFLGVLMIARPAWLFGGAIAPDYPWAYAFVALLGSLLSAGAYVTVRRLGRSEHPLVVVLYFPLVTVPLAAPFALPGWLWPNATEWLWLLGVGASTAIAQVALTKGLAREPAGRATAVGYLQVALATLFGAFVFGVWPDPWSWAGMLLILVSLLGSLRRSG